MSSRMTYWRIYGNENNKDCGRLGISFDHVHKDNGSNIVKVMSETGLPSFGYFAHSLQLVVHDGPLAQHVVINLLAMCRCIIGHFRHSSGLPQT